MKKSIACAALVLFLMASPACAQDAAPPELPKELSAALDAAQDVTLYSLQPQGGPDLPGWDFHGQHILGRTELHKDEAKGAIAALKDAVMRGVAHATFEITPVPRQALRLVSGGHTYDILICYECRQLELFDNDHPMEFNGLIRGKPDALNALLAEAGIPLADTPKAFSDGYAEEAKQAQALAEKGDKQAQNVYGRLLTGGRGVATNEDEGKKWLAKAWDLAETDPVFQIRIGRMYYLGANIRQDYTEAMKLFSAAAEQGSAAGQYLLGNMYETGAGTSIDNDAALEWFHKAADQGEPRAAYEIGVMYARGQGVTQDDAEALKWFRKAGEGGHPGALSWIASMYKDGQGVKPDRVEQYFWTRLAEEYGTPYQGALPELTTDQKAAAEKRIADWKAAHKPCAVCNE